MVGIKPMETTALRYFKRRNASWETAQSQVEWTPNILENDLFIPQHIVESQIFFQYIVGKEYLKTAGTIYCVAVYNCWNQCLKRSSLNRMISSISCISCLVIGPGACNSRCSSRFIGSTFIPVWAVNTSSAARS
jgi:ATP-dependent protease Clp ATPase subunit